MPVKEILNEKIQVLVSSDDLYQLNQILMRKATAAKTRVIPLSLYIRLLLKNHIVDNQPEQSSYTKEAIKKIKTSK